MLRWFFFVVSLFVHPGCDFLDISSHLQDASGSTTSNFSSSTSVPINTPMAKGVMKSVEDSLGLFMKKTGSAGSLETARLLVTGSTVYGNAYLGIAQEDVFYYSRFMNAVSFAKGRNGGQGSSCHRRPLQVASHPLFKGDISSRHEKNRVSLPFPILREKTVNVGAFESDTYITAKTILIAYGTAYTTKKQTQPKKGLQR